MMQIAGHSMRSIVLAGIRPHIGRAAKHWHSMQGEGVLSAISEGDFDSST
jgi:hypothetical protein